MRDIEPIIAAGTESVRTVLNRPKNQVKGDFSENLDELLADAHIEMSELNDEVYAPVIDYEKTMYESADACAYLFQIIKVCRDRLGKTGSDKKVKDILADYLKASGFDGLCSDSCGCGIENLAPCDNNPIFCRPAHKVKADCLKCPAKCEAYDEEGHGDGYCYQAEARK